MSTHKSLQKIIILGAQGVGACPPHSRRRRAARAASLTRPPSRAGKTSLMERFVAQKFTSQYKATIGADFSTKDVTVGNELVTLQIWDTAGQERYQSLGTAFYRGADACVLVYDVSDAMSFTKLESWRTAFLSAADIKDPQTFPFVVLGNKADLEAPKHIVQTGAVGAWCDKHGKIPSFLVSAKTGDNVESAFLNVVKAAAARVKEEEPISESLATLAVTLPPLLPRPSSHAHAHTHARAHAHAYPNFLSRSPRGAEARRSAEAVRKRVRLLEL